MSRSNQTDTTHTQSDRPRSLLCAGKLELAEFWTLPVAQQHASGWQEVTNCASRRTTNSYTYEESTRDRTVRCHQLNYRYFLSCCFLNFALARRTAGTNRKKAIRRSEIGREKLEQESSERASKRSNTHTLTGRLLVPRSTQKVAAAAAAAAAGAQFTG